MKLPVLKAFRMTYAFAWRNFWDVLRVAWLPLSINALVLIWANIAFDLETGPGAGATNTDSLMAQLGMFSAFIAIILFSSLIVSPILSVGLLRPIVRGTWPRGPFYLGYGRDELRIMGAFAIEFCIALVPALITVLLAGVIVYLIGFASGAGHAEISARGQMISVLMATIIAIVGVTSLVWIALRLLVVAPATLAIERIGIGRSWALTKGNFWRLFAFSILVVGPLFVLQFVDSLILGTSTLDELAQWIKGSEMKPFALGYAVLSQATQLLFSALTVIATGVAFVLLGSSLGDERVQPAPA